MELIELKNRILSSFSGEKEDLANILQTISEDKAIFPFNEYEHLLSHFLSSNDMTFEQYMEIRTEYINSNPNLWVFEISAPRSFGEKFAQTYVKGICPELEKPSRELDESYSGEYDFWLDGIKIEVKASRVVNASSGEPLYMKALSSNTTQPFLMNFQQLKPSCCDVFIWVAVYRDVIKLWVLGSGQVASHALYSRGQHRENYGNEGQLHVKHDNINQLEDYEFKNGDNIQQKIIDAAQHSFTA